MYMCGVVEMGVCIRMAAWMNSCAHPQKNSKSLASNSCMFLHPNNNFSICDFMVDNPQEGRLSRKRKKLKETFEESCGEESRCLFALIHVCHLEDTQCTSSGLIASTSKFSPNVDSSTVIALPKYVAMGLHSYIFWQAMTCRERLYFRVAATFEKLITSLCDFFCLLILARLYGSINPVFQDPLIEIDAVSSALADRGHSVKRAFQKWQLLR
ncbi:unnamed protein product [Cercopithifilaria johnstoni]|uniref:Uncharacterized protein n=1 Tax=Cercopithifilaria johnstoni TaxID=2874296 RepID=A0A8J2Q623_9BILA|nr:unnamed protein product [Cercopithifilaria johnstoni]